MVSSDIINIINELEKSSPVDEWVIDGLHIWPLIRITTYFNFIHAHHQAASPLKASPIQRLSLAYLAFKGFLKYLCVSILDYRMNAAPNHFVDVVFLSDGFSFSYINDSWYEKFIDPLYRRFQARNRSCLLMTLSGNYFVPRHTPSFFIQPSIDLRKFASLFYASINLIPPPWAPSYNELVERAKLLGAAQFLPPILSVTRQAGLVRSITDFFLTVFQTARPKMGFVVSYYSLEGMAFNLACREFGIPSVDIQHGVAGELCPPYGRWQRVPMGGYGLLPSVFWSWSDADAAAIERWSPGGLMGHTAVVGGNPWLLEWQADDNEMIRKFDQKFAEIYPLLSSGCDRRGILVTLQHGISTQAHLAPLLAAMRKAPASWFWLVRLHPCMLQEKCRIAALMNDCGIVNFELEYATELPLFTLLRHADVHITHSSATVYEATAFCVPSVIFSAYGAEFFSQQIAQGWARTAYSPEAILLAIERQDKERHNLRNRHSSRSVDLGEVLSKLTGKLPKVQDLT